jgi:hypothetical protein
MYGFIAQFGKLCMGCSPTHFPPVTQYDNDALAPTPPCSCPVVAVTVTHQRSTLAHLQDDRMTAQHAILHVVSLCCSSCPGILTLTLTVSSSPSHHHHYPLAPLILTISLALTHHFAVVLSLSPSPSPSYPCPLHLTGALVLTMPPSCPCPLAPSILTISLVSLSPSPLLSCCLSVSLS